MLQARDLKLCVWLAHYISNGISVCAYAFIACALLHVSMYLLHVFIASFYAVFYEARLSAIKKFFTHLPALNQNSLLS